MRRLLTTHLVLVMLIFAGCINEKQEVEKSVANIDIELPHISTITSIRIDETIVLGLKGNRNENVEWKSENPNISVVNGICRYNGDVKSAWTTSSTITAKSSGTSASIKIVFREKSDYMLEMNGSFITWGGRANDKIDTLMEYKGNGVWEKIVEVTNDEEEFVPDWMAEWKPVGADVNANFTFSDIMIWDILTDERIHYGAERFGTIVETNGNQQCVQTYITGGFAYFTKLEKNKTYKFSVNTKKLTMKVEEVK